MITLTSKIGKFFFSADTQISHAKLVRDTVVGQWFNPPQGSPKLSSEQDAYEFMWSHDSAVLRNIPFELELA